MRSVMGAQPLAGAAPYHHGQSCKAEHCDDVADVSPFVAENEGHIILGTQHLEGDNGNEEQQDNA